MKWITVLLALFSLFYSPLNAQNSKHTNHSNNCHIFKGRNPNFNPTYHIINNVVYEDSNLNTALYTFYNNKVYKGNSTVDSNIQYVIRDKYIYEISQGKEKILLNLKDGEIYNRDSNSRLEILYTLKDGKIYKGRSTSTLDIVMTFCENYTNKELIALLTYLTFT